MLAVVVVVPTWAWPMFVQDPPPWFVTDHAPVLLPAMIASMRSPLETPDGIAGETDVVPSAFAAEAPPYAGIATEASYALSTVIWMWAGVLSR